MYENGVSSEAEMHYNIMFCQACLSANRTLTTLGDYVDIYFKICENSRMNMSAQINICWECLALLKKVRAFKKKVDNAQKILDYCTNKQVPLKDTLSDLALSTTEVTTFVPILAKHDYELDKPDIKLEPEDCEKDQLMFKIEDVRGQCDIVDVKPVLDLSSSPSCAVTVKTEPLSPEGSEDAQRHNRWKRAAMLVFRRICSHSYARPFLRPVTDELAPLYSRIVRRPTDISNIRRRIREDIIRTTEELRHAMLLMFSNALMYNSSDHDIYHIARELQKETTRELNILAAVQAHAATLSTPFTRSNSELSPLRRRPQEPTTPNLRVKLEPLQSLPNHRGKHSETAQSSLHNHRGKVSETSQPFSEPSHGRGKNGKQSEQPLSLHNHRRGNYSEASEPSLPNHRRGRPSKASPLSLTNNCVKHSEPSEPSLPNHRRGRPSKASLFSLPNNRVKHGEPSESSLPNHRRGRPSKTCQSSLPNHRRGKHSETAQSSLPNRGKHSETAQSSLPNHRGKHSETAQSSLPNRGKHSETTQSSLPNHRGKHSETTQSSLPNHRGGKHSKTSPQPLQPIVIIKKEIELLPPTLCPTAQKHRDAQPSHVSLNIRRRSEWDWPEIEHLVAIKKYKTSNAVLL